MILAIISSIALITGDSERDFYKILGLQYDCTKSQIKKSYMKLSKKYHPDKNKESEEMYNDINDAYATLFNPIKRRIYDLYGEAGVHQFEAPQAEIDPLNAFFKPNQETALEKIKKVGKPVLLEFPVELIDFYEGRLYPLYITRKTICRCPEKGYYCAKCKGSPTTTENLTLKVMVEKGADEGIIIPFKNAGDITEEYGAGDINVKIVSKPHPIFTRIGSDLHVTFKVTLHEALFGFKRTIEHLDGSKIEIDSQKLVAGENVLILEGKGLPRYLYPGMMGDIVVHTEIMWPELSEENVEKIQKAFPGF